MILTNFNGEDVANQKVFVYQILNSAGELIYIGCDNFMLMGQAHGLETDDKLLTISVIATYDSLTEGTKHAKRLADKLKPKCEFQQCKHKVLCVELNMEFNSIREASRTLGVNASAISNHLRGLKGYRRLKGFTFKYV